jgi:hypothetical protein
MSIERVLWDLNPSIKWDQLLLIIIVKIPNNLENYTLIEYKRLFFTFPDLYKNFKV